MLDYCYVWISPSAISYFSEMYLFQMVMCCTKSATRLLFIYHAFFNIFQYLMFTGIDVYCSQHVLCDKDTKKKSFKTTILKIHHSRCGVTIHFSCSSIFDTYQRCMGLLDPLQRRDEHIIDANFVAMENYTLLKKSPQKPKCYKERNTFRKHR